MAVRGIDPCSPTPPPVQYGFVDLPERPVQTEQPSPEGLPEVTSENGEDRPPVRSYQGRQVDTYA